MRPDSTRQHLIWSIRDCHDATHISDSGCIGAHAKFISGMNWSELFPDADYGFTVRVRRCPPATYFHPRDPTGALLAQRQHWLDTAAHYHLACTEAARPLIQECSELLATWGIVPSPQPAHDGSPAANLAALGRQVEPDLLLLRREATACRLAAGCVCFPSSWSLREKLELTVDQIHGIVPGLNPAIGRPINQFLARLAPGVAWCRDNWGLSRSGELNQDPWRQLPRLTPGLDPASVWLRIEHQALLALPKSNGVLFAIRIVTLPLADLPGVPTARHGLRRALLSMPEDVATYKGLQTIRPAIAAWLAQSPEPAP